MRSKIDQILEVGLSFLMGLMVLNVLWQVASRYLLNDPSAFTDELSRYMLIWVGLLGAAYASGKNLHVAIELLERKLSPSQRHLQAVTVQLLIIFFSIVMMAGGARLVYISFHLGQLSSAMQLPLGYVYLALPLSGLLIMFYCICDLVDLKNSNNG